MQTQIHTHFFLLSPSQPCVHLTRLCWSMQHHIIHYFLHSKACAFFCLPRIKNRLDLPSRCSLDGGPAPTRTKRACHTSPLPFLHGKFVKINVCCDIVALQWCVSFCYMAKWAGHTHTHLFSGFPSHWGHHGALSSLPCGVQFSLVFYFIQNTCSVCYNSSHPSPLSPPGVHDCSFHMCLYFHFVRKTVCTNFFRFHMYGLIYDIYFSLSDFTLYYRL